VLMSYLKDENVIHPKYPDLSRFKVYS